MLEQRRVDAGDREEYPVELPTVREAGGAIELDPARLERLRKHVDLAVVLEDERIGKVVGALERRARLRDSPFESITA